MAHAFAPNMKREGMFNSFDLYHGTHERNRARRSYVIINFKSIGCYQLRVPLK